MEIHKQIKFTGMINDEDWLTLRCIARNKGMSLARMTLAYFERELEEHKGE